MEDGVSGRPAFVGHPVSVLGLLGDWMISTLLHTACDQPTPHRTYHTAQRHDIGMLDEFA